jgi:Thioredoxin
VPAQFLVGLVALTAAVTTALALGLVRRYRDGRLRQTMGGTPDAAAAALTALGVVPGTPATLVHFSTAVCAPCRVVRRVCAEAVQRVNGVVQLEVDAQAHPDAVRALGIWRAPTLLVVDRTGRIVRRATGTPTLGEVLAALMPLVGSEVPG